MLARDETELCERLLPLLRAFGRRRLRDRDAADELAQEALVITLTALREGRVSGTQNVGAYVLGVARNLAREGYRRERRERRLVDALVPLHETARPSLESDQRLRRCFSRLTRRARAVLTLAIIEDHRAPEIADSLGISPGNVRVIRHRALAEVRRCMQTEGR